MKLLVSIIYVAIIGILAHYIGESLPRTWFKEVHFPYKEFFWESDGRFFKIIKIKRWKTKLPDMSRIMRDMLPKRIDSTATSHSVSALISETCVAEFVHFVLCIFSIGIYMIWKNYIGIILMLVFIICNIPFILIQRYNRPNLICLRNRLQKREERSIIETVDTVL